VSVLSFSLWLSASLPGALVTAALLTQPAEQAKWQLNSDPFYCQLQQQVRGLGQVSFALEPGQPLRLNLALAQPHSALQQVSVMARPADWQTTQPVAAQQYVAELYQDSEVSFLQAARNRGS
jgi:hypothetical protein